MTAFLLFCGAVAYCVGAIVVSGKLHHRFGATCQGLPAEPLPAEPPRKRRRRMIAAAHILPRAGLPTTTVRAERGADTDELARNLARAGASILSGERQA